MARSKKVSAQLDLLGLFGGAAPTVGVVEQSPDPLTPSPFHPPEEKKGSGSAHVNLSAEPTLKRLRTEDIIHAGALAQMRASMRGFMGSGAFDFKRAASAPVSALGKEALADKDRELRARAPGWLREAALAADEMMWGRWEWWINCALLGRIIEGEIPQIELHGERGAGGVELTKKMLWWCVDSIAYGNRWEALRFFIDWLAWALGVDKAASCPPAHSVHESACALLNERLVLEMIQLYPADYLGEMLCEFGHGQGKGEHAFFPTPMDLCSLMGQLTHPIREYMTPEELELEKRTSAYDCACGTGRTLLVASNRSLRLYGQDIDGQVIRCTAINLFLFAPWGAMPLPHLFDPDLPEPINLELARLMGLADLIVTTSFGPAGSELGDADIPL